MPLPLLSTLLALSPAIAPAAAPPVQALTWDANAPVLAQARGFSSQFRGSAMRLTGPGEPVRAGAHALRVELDRGGNNISGPRAELADDDTLSGERWYGFSVFLDRSWQPDPAPDIITQWHGVGGVGGGGSPALSLGTQNGRWIISQNPDNHYKDTPVGDAQTGRWVDWVVHVRWSSGHDGFLTVWRDGNVVYSRNNQQTGYSGNPGTYLKFGIYKWPWAQGQHSTSTRRIVYEDELRIASATGSYAAVAPPRR